MGKKFTSALTPKVSDLNPFEKRKLDPRFPLDRTKAVAKAYKEDISPKMPEPTEAEVELQNRQKEEIARLNDEENMRLKRGLRGRGSRQLSSRRPGARTGMLGGAAPAAASGGSAGATSPGGRSGAGRGQYN